MVELQCQKRARQMAPGVIDGQLQTVGGHLRHYVLNIIC